MTEEEIKKLALKKYPLSQGQKWSKIVEQERSLLRKAFAQGIRVGLKMSNQLKK